MELSPKLYHWLIRPQWYVIRYNRQIVQRLLSRFDFAGKRVLDFGCGTGANCYLFQPGQYIGLDCSRQRIDYARSLYPDYRFDLTAGSRLPLEDGSMDYVFVMAVLHHISPSDCAEVISDFKRVLRPEGRVLLIEPCLLDTRSLRNYLMQACDRGRYISNENSYRQLFSENGFKVEYTQQFNKGFYSELFLVAAPSAK